MDQQNTQQKTNPLIIAACVAVIAASGVAIGSMTGLIGKKSETAETVVTTPSIASAGDNGAASAGGTSQGAAVPAPTIKEAPAVVPAQPVSKPVQHSAPKHSAPVVAAAAPASQGYTGQTMQNGTPVAQAPAVCSSCGRVSEVNERTRKGEGSGLGAIAGGIAGAVLGNQVGEGRGRTAMSILGAAGGAYAGNAVEKNVKSSKYYEVVVSLDDGATRVFTFEQLPSWRAGDRVKVVNGQLQSN